MVKGEAANPAVPSCIYTSGIATPASAARSEVDHIVATSRKSCRSFSRVRQGVHGQCSSCSAFLGPILGHRMVELSKSGKVDSDLTLGDVVF